MINISEIQVGDCFSESTHYKAINKTTKGVELFHLESGKTVTLSNDYVANLLQTADQYEKEVIVTKEDTKTGEKGIRSIFEGIHSSQVFTVCFRKADEKLSATKLKALREAQIATAITNIEDAARSKKGVANAAKLALASIQENPISPIIEGELRELTGYKKSFSTNDGKYDVVDMDLMPNVDIARATRQVNINTIQWLIIDNIKYTVK